MFVVKNVTNVNVITIRIHFRIAKVSEFLQKVESSLSILILECNCFAIGTKKNTACDAINGKCSCKVGYVGDKCSFSVKALGNHVKINHSSNDIPAKPKTEAKGTKPKRKTERKFPCDSCKRVFNSRPGLRHHKQVVHEKLRFSCAECLKTFTKKQWFNAHRCEKTNEN